MGFHSGAIVIAFAYQRRQFETGRVRSRPCACAEHFVLERLVVEADASGNPVTFFIRSMERSTVVLRVQVVVGRILAGPCMFVWIWGDNV